MSDWARRADQLAGNAYAGGEPTAWFERLYAEGVAGQVSIPWDRSGPHPLLADWAATSHPDGTGRPAVVVGCGLGADAEFLASLGFTTTGFDISPTAIELARKRHPQSPVDYRVADLLDLPDDLVEAFDLVVEIYTLQALPDPPRSAAARAVVTLVRPGGTLLAVAFRQDGKQPYEDGPPFPLTRETMTGLAVHGLRVVALEEHAGTENNATLWRAEYRRGGPDHRRSS